MVVVLLGLVTGLGGCTKLKSVVRGSPTGASTTPSTSSTPPSPPEPTLVLSRLSSTAPTSMVSGRSYIEIIELSNPNAPGIPIEIGSIRNNPSLATDGAEIDWSACNSIQIAGATTCKIYIRYTSPGVGTLDVTPEFEYSFTQSGTRQDKTLPHPMRMRWVGTADGSTAVLDYQSPSLFFTKGGFPHSWTPVVRGATAGDSLRFALTDFRGLPSGMHFDPATGKVSGAHPTGDGSGSIEVCLVKNNILTQACSIITLVGIAEEVISPDPSPCTGLPGNGSSSDPYQLSSPEQFDSCLRSHSAQAFVLVRDIDFQGYAMSPIEQFSGSLDGQGHTLLNYSFFETPTTGPVGFFRTVNSGSVIKDLSLSGFSVDSDCGYYAGVLAGRVRNALISSISIQNSRIAGCYGIGGLTGLYEGFTTGKYLGGAIEQITISDIQLHDYDIDWSAAGGAIGIMSSDMRIRLSHLKVESLRTRNLGNAVGGVIGASWVALSLATDRPNSIIWLDGATSSGVIVGHEFVGGIMGVVTGLDIVSNVGTTATLGSDYSMSGLSGRIGGLFGTIGGNPTSTAQERPKLSQSYFAGSFIPAASGLTPRVGSLVGDTTYRNWGGMLYLTDVFKLSTISVPDLFSGGRRISGNTLPLSDNQFRDPANFPLWPGAWNVQRGSYPSQ